MNARPNGFFLRVAPALLYVAVIFYMGSIPNPPNLGMTFSAKDKLMHLGAFCGMLFVVFRAIEWERRSYSLARQLAIAFALTSLLGGLLELWQTLLPARSAELLDWVADTLGAGIGAALIKLAYHFRSSEQDAE